MNLDDVNRGISKHKKRRRIGRGTGSGYGKTAGRGHKGQKSRSGWSRQAVFQGGAMPLVRRVPKRGFNNRFAKVVYSVNVGDLEKKFEAGEEVTPQLLRERNVAKARYDELKILGDGELTKKLKVSAHRFSASAKEKIEKAGGEIVVLAGNENKSEAAPAKSEAAAPPEKSAPETSAPAPETPPQEPTGETSEGEASEGEASES